MTVQAAAARPVGKTSGGAGLGALLQLGVFVAVVITFLVAPLLALAVAFLVYTVMRGRGEAERPAAGGTPSGSVVGFGSGAGR
jgi:phosphate/sulfate permease